jgi:hypothetical protein
MREEDMTMKRMAIRYKLLEDLFDREEKMLKTLDNYLAREQDYEFHKSYIEQDEDCFRLVLEIKLRDGNY